MNSIPFKPNNYTNIFTKLCNKRNDIFKRHQYFPTPKTKCILEYVDYNLNIYNEHIINMKRGRSLQKNNSNDWLYEHSEKMVKEFTKLSDSVKF